jgi:hypothetical protein
VTGIITLPKVKQGVTLIGSCGGGGDSVDTFAPKTIFPKDKPMFKDLLGTSGLPEEPGDILINRQTLPKHFSEVELLPQHELRMGDQVLIPKGQCRLA